MSRNSAGFYESGFTLLELLVAVTLVVVMAVGAWSALDLCVRTWTHGMETIDANQRERSTQDLVRKQIASAYPLVPAITSLSAGARNAANQILATSTPIFSGGETSLRFISPNSLMSTDSAGVFLVTYETEVDSDDNIHLVQREAPYIGQSIDDGWFTSAAYVFFNLKELTFEYYDPGDVDNPAEWLTEWDTADRRRMPAAVRISMLYKDPDGGSPGLQMIIPLHAQYNIQSLPRQQLNQRRQLRTKPTP
jgi:prepilin-type N-terminal cleavage/methylation domain-containing protein